MYAKTCKICQQFKKRNNIYGHLPPKIIAELKPWDSVHVDLIGTSIKKVYKTTSAMQAIIKNNVSLTCMTMIDPVTGWFKFFEILT